MRVWQLCLVGMLLFTAGCTGVDPDTDQSRLDLTVQNEQTQAITFQLTVTDGDGVALTNESAQLARGIGQTFDFTVGTSGRHEATVIGDEWQATVGWNADSCARYEGRVRITNEGVTVAGECLTRQ